MAELTVPKMDFSSLGNLPKVYREAQDRQTLASLGQQLADGTINYRQAAGMAAQTGNLDPVLKFLALSETERKRLADEKTDAAITAGWSKYTDQPVTNAPASGAPKNDFIVPGQSEPPVNVPRQPVGPTSRVWGDNEAEQAGLYEPRIPTHAAAQAPNARPESRLSLASLGNASQPQPNPVPSAVQPAPTPQARIDSSYGDLYRADADPNSAMPPGASRSEFDPVRVAQNGGSPAAPSPAAAPAVPQAGASGLSPRGQFALQVLVKRNASEGQRAAARMFLEQELKTPEAIQRYNFAVKQGFEGTLLDYELALRRAQAITNDMRGENAEAKGLGEGAAKRANETMAAASSAAKNLQSLSRMETMLGQIEQGKVQPARMTVSAWAKSFGLDDTVAERLGLDPKGVGTAQAVQALSNELAMGRIGPGGIPANNFSDADRNFITVTVPQLAEDPRANKIKIESARRMEQLNIQKAREWMQYRRNAEGKGKSYDDFEIEWADRIAKKDLFGDLRREAEAMIGPRPAGSSPQRQGQPMQTAPGARQAPDGQFYVPDPNRPGKFLRVVQ